MKYRVLPILALSFATTIFADDTFTSNVTLLTPGMQKTLKAQLKPAHCPAIIDHLLLLTVSYYGMDNKPHQGQIIVNKTIANDTIDIFKQLFAVKYHIQQVTPFATYPNNEFAKNNATVGYYCANAPTPQNDSDAHAEGKAIDINPLMNPYVADNVAWPVEGSQYIVRDDAPGVIRPGHKTYQIFINHGWSWGGEGRGDNPNYMHFEKK